MKYTIIADENLPFSDSSFQFDQKDLQLSPPLAPHFFSFLTSLFSDGHNLVFIFNDQSLKHPVKHPFVKWCEVIAKNEGGRLTVFNRSASAFEMTKLFSFLLSILSKKEKQGEEQGEEQKLLFFRRIKDQFGLFLLKTEDADFLQGEDEELLKKWKEEKLETFFSPLIGKQFCLAASLKDLAYAIKHPPRMVVEKRITKETEIEIKINLDGSGKAKINTGLGFFNHMLESLAKHGGFDLTVDIKGDLHIDEHHTIEDCGLTLGSALSKALLDKKGIGRFGFVLPMDEASASCSLDLSGRAYLVYEVSLKREKVGDFPCEMLEHFFESFAKTAGANIHLKASGDNDHHVIEACFKALGRSLRQAICIEEKRGDEVPSTKGVL